MPTTRKDKCNTSCLRQSVFCLVVITLFFLTSTLDARPGALPMQARRTTDGIALHQALLDLTNAWTVMCVAAHPDDEDGATLTVLRRKFGVHTVSLFSTFGEGGQNAIGPELYEELGAIRAEETLKASEIQGSEPHFLGLKDFGFSKSADEAFRVWGHEEALRRMVLEIRRLRPDVIITNHDTTSGHGHHQATGRLVLEAFDAAADHNRFAEQLKTWGVWQVQRLFVRMSRESGANSKKLDEESVRAGNVIAIDRNERDPERNTTYAEQALLALQQHATQGPWPQTLPKEGWPPVRYRLAREAKDTEPLPRDPQNFVDGLKHPREIEGGLLSLATIQSFGDIDSQRRSRFTYVATACDSTTRSNVVTSGRNASRIRLFGQRCDTALASLSGITATLRSVDAVLVPNSSARVVLEVTNKGTREAVIKSVIVNGVNRLKELAPSKRLAPGTTVSLTSESLISRDERLSVPRSAHLYDEQLLGKAFYALISVAVDGKSFLVRVSTRVDVAPAVEIANLTPTRYVFNPANLSRPLQFRVRLKNNQNKPFKGQFGIESTTDHGTEVGSEIALAANETRDFTIRSNVIPVDTADEKRTPRNNFGPIVIRVHPWESSNVISEREISVVYSDARVVPNLRVGYVRSFDDTLRDSLIALGVESKELSIDDISTGDLQSYDSIVIDNRGYMAHPELVNANTRLLDYARNGGNLIVFYHRTNEWNPDSVKNRPSLAPYPITLGNDRVTDENAPVTFTEPLHPLLNTPNKLGPDDFKGWIQERGLYYPKSWDTHYQSLFAMSDPGEESLRGGLLVADYGKGHYIYTSMVWYRQLRAGVPGGYRMFANMISYEKR